MTFLCTTHKTTIIFYRFHGVVRCVLLNFVLHEMRHVHDFIVFIVYLYGEYRRQRLTDAVRHGTSCMVMFYHPIFGCEMLAAENQRREFTIEAHANMYILYIHVQ